MSILYILLAIRILDFGRAALEVYNLKLQIELARLQADIRRREQHQVDINRGARRFPRRSRCSRSSAR